jgi:thiol-disulfide isomerase/thioredoxin
MKRAFTSGRSRVALLAIAAVVGVIGWSLSCSRAAEPAEDDAAVLARAAAKYPIPKGDAAKLAAFLEEMAQAEEQGDTPEAQMESAKEILHTIVAASDRLLAAKPDEEQTQLAYEYHLVALQGLRDLGGEKDAEKYDAALNEVMTNPAPEIATVGWKRYIASTLGRWDMLDDDAKAKFAADIIKQLKTGQPTSLDVRIVATVASQLELMGEVDFVSKLLSGALPLLQKDASPELLEDIESASLVGMERRLNLMGRPMEVFGDLLGGGEIDWKSYRGKVVLVDFSATWCPECIKEAPNVVEMYKTYKDKGFDVIAVSLDRTQEAAEQYIADNKIAWSTLFPAKEDDRFWSHPLVKHYGITGIPTAILVDQKGNVVSLDARGPALREKLAQLLGPPDAKAASRKAAVGARAAGG